MKDTSYNWLTKDYLQDILRRHKEDAELKVLEFHTELGTTKGENYASVITRLTVHYQLSNATDVEKGSYILKTTHEGDPFITSIQSKYDLYHTEMFMYEKVLPKITELLHSIGDNDKLFADTIHVDYKRSAIIFEDLSVHDFAIADRIAGFDEAHTKLVLKKLAKMHATAAVLNQQTNGDLQRLDHGIFNRHTKGFAPFFEGLVAVCADFAEHCPQLGVYYKKKLQKLVPHVMDYATHASIPQPNDGHFYTLNHGDFWVNNIMFRYDKDSPQQIKDSLLIDFQFSNWTSPAWDLHYLFNTSLQSDLRLHQQDMFVQYYHEILVSTLTQLKFQGYRPSLHELQTQLEARRFIAVVSTLVVQTMMINDKTEDADFNALMKNDERGRNFRKLLYTNKVVQNNMIALLPIFDRRGLLDVVEN